MENFRTKAEIKGGGPKTVAPAKPVGPAQKRITLHSPPAMTEVANIWAAFAEPGTFTLLHRYPDLSPVVGWHVHCDGVAYEVKTVAMGVTGAVLGCDVVAV